MHSPATLAYFCAPPGHLWEWEYYDGYADECIIWSGDQENLIVYRKELQGLLPACVPGGFPPLGAILFVIAACAQNYNARRIRILLWEAAERATGNPNVPSGIPPLWKKVGAALDRIHALPLDLRASGPARFRLLQTLFGESSSQLPRRLSAERSQAVLDEFLQTPNTEAFRQRTPELNGVARLLADLNALEKAFQNCPPEHLEERLRTGIDEIPTRQLELPLPQPDDTPAPDIPADLLRALEHEGGELAQVAGLVRRMSAILHVPKAVTHRDEMPLGGVSDITNRGDPSRLLMTELAWDDLTFAVRLSQGEALYLRRESPPAEPPPRRRILIDTGIFMWGKPRLFALGAALALLRQKQGSQAIVGQVMAADGDVFTAITLDTVDDVRAQLIRLQPHPHPSSALSSLLEDDDAPLQPQEEVFLITHSAACEQLTAMPLWQRLAAAVPLHTLMVDRDGVLQLARHSLAGAKTLSEMRVDAEYLFQPSQPSKSTTPKPSPAALTDEAGRLPQFYRQKPWPLCHPGAPAKGKVYQLGSKGFIGLSNTKCVCWWSSRITTGRVLAPVPPTENIAGILVDPDDENRVLVFFRSDDMLDLHILVTALDGCHDAGVVRYHGRLQDVDHLRIQSGALVLLDQGVYKALNIHTSQVIASAAPERTHQSPPWFDGEAFHFDHGAPLPVLKITTPAKEVRPGIQFTRISDIAGVGFGSTGGLFVQMIRGRGYKLDLRAKGELAWIYSDEAANFQLLQPLESGENGSNGHRGLMQTVFADGRRVIFDPCGFLHVCDSGDDAQELSLLMIKGSTAAWQRKAFHYGDESLLWTKNIGAHTVLQSLCRSLFRRIEHQKTPKASSSFHEPKGLF